MTMSLLHQIWALSALSAILFLVAGFLVGRRRGQARLGRVLEEQELLREGLREVEAERATYRELLEQRHAELEAALAEVESSRSTTVEHEALAIELENLRETQAGRDALLSDREAEVEALRAVAAETEAQLREGQAELNGLRQVASDRESRLRVAKAELAAAREVASERDSRLREAEAELETLRQRCARAEATTRRLQELRTAAPKDRPKPSAPRNGSRPGLFRSEKSLEGTLAAVAEGPQNLATVVADDLGFPIVGRGEHQEALAALCGVLIDVRERARSLLPIGFVHRITLEAERSLTISACAAPHEDALLTLATLTAGPGLDTPDLRGALHQLGAALARGETRAVKEMIS